MIRPIFRFPSRSLAGLGPVLLLLAACAPAPASSPTAATSGGATAQPAGQAPTQAGAASGTLELGAAISQSGSLVKEGGYVRDGYEFWKDTVNANGGINIGGKKYNVAIKYYDDKSDTQTAVKLVEKLITEDNDKIVLGPFGSGITNATAAVGEKYKALTIASMANADNIYQQGFKYTAGILPLGSTQTKPVLEMAKAEGLKTIAITSPDDLYPLTVAQAAESMAKDNGLEVVYFQRYPKGAQDLSTVVSEIKAKNPDALISTGYLNEITLMTRHLKDLSVNPKVVAFTGATTFPDYYTGLPGLSEGVLGMDWWTPDSGWKGGPWGDSRPYADAFKKRFNYDPGYVSAAGSQAGLILQMALEKAGTTDPDKVRDALFSLDAETFFGQFKLDDRGVNVKGSAIVRQVQNGTPVVVWPEQNAKAPLQLPKPAF